ncbi:hypothetical protein [Chryseobacterium kwangjuense]|uniref:Uncharacterized protein n=1 Tax=Chryseobacterium kwangjuense TaxID=267125 RepID=A0A135WJT5_9FLAO|nr:hypothetical protein [Chryseobacterium kwangjuense]KXH85135.1 hypothetical protein AU378_05120 [Chryseobacterium kwangjuense]
MASCFIIFKDGRCFFRRLTCYDYILRIAIKELSLMENGKPLAEWLELQIPLEYSHWGTVTECTSQEGSGWDTKQLNH